MKGSILFLLKLPPPLTGATLMNQYIYNSDLIKKHFNVSFIVASYRKKIKKNSLAIFNKLYIFFKVWIKLLVKLVTKRPHQVYFQFSPLGGAFYRDAFLALTVKLFGVSVLYHIRVYGIYENSINKRFNKWLYKTIFKKNFIACHSENMFFDFKNVYDNKPIVIRNGLEDRFAKINKDFKKRDTIPQLLFISNFLRSKGIETLLEACAILKSKNIPFYIHLIGDYTHDYSHADLLNLIQEKNIEENTNLIGPVFGKAKDNYLMNCDIFIFPTLYEAFGNVVIEAMQASKPVVVTNEGSLPLIVENGVEGFIVEKNDPGAIADRVVTLINDPELMIKMGKAGREKFLKNYTLDIFEKNFVNTLKALVSQDEFTGNQ